MGLLPTLIFGRLGHLRHDWKTNPAGGGTGFQDLSLPSFPLGLQAVHAQHPEKPGLTELGSEQFSQSPTNGH